MTLDRLRCPHCGTTLALQEGPATRREGASLTWGVLGCECCAYPVVDGIPILIASDDAREALRLLEAGQPDEALRQCLGLDEERWRAFTWLRGVDTASYRDYLEVLSPDAEGTYFLYRFSDPTFVAAEAVVRAAAGVPDLVAGPVLDVCGGSGHLTRVLAEVATGPVFLADVYFWKLWLARTFTVPEARVVCCDANQPLPFARQTFSAVLLSDAFPYIWQRRLLAAELMRAVRPGGAILMPHLHNALAFNYSAGMALTPAAYEDLFAPVTPRLFDDATLLDQALAGGPIDLAASQPAEALAEAAALTLLASPRPELFARHAQADPGPVRGVLRLNPLYTVERQGDRLLCTLTFPSDEYAEEFGAVRRYLPDRWETAVDVRGVVEPGAFGDRLVELRRRRILLDVPARYC